MTLAKWAKRKGMNLTEYRELRKQVKELAVEKIGRARELHAVTGMYFPIKELFENIGELECFIIDEMKELGFEYVEAEKKYRVVNI